MHIWWNLLSSFYFSRLTWGPSPSFPQENSTFCNPSPDFDKIVMQNSNFTKKWNRKWHFIMPGYTVLYIHYQTFLLYKLVVLGPVERQPIQNLHFKKPPGYLYTHKKFEKYWSAWSYGWQILKCWKFKLYTWDGAEV